MQDAPQTAFNFVDVTATKKIFQLRKRIRAVTGGTSASKTISILVWIIDYCQDPRNKAKLASVVSESFPHLSRGAMRDFENIMKDRGYWDDRRWNKQDHCYTFETGNKCEFISVDTYGKAHGPRRHILFINECNNLPYNIADQLITRTKEVIWLDWNPVSEFWFYEDMLPYRDDLDFITLTYKDNEALDENSIREIESHRNNPAWWTVYGLGQLGQIEGRIYKDWIIIDDVPQEAKLRRYGLDFGYTNDPTASVAAYNWNNSFILDEVMYQKGMSNKDIADIFLNIPRALIVGDSAEPKSIAEIGSYGLNIIPSQKGPGSLLQGIQYVQDQKIFVTKRSTNILKEYRNYLWMTDKTGKIVNEPQPIWDHQMDAIRYALESLRPMAVRKPQTNFGGVRPFIEGTLA